MNVLATLAGMVHGGALVCFALLFMARARIPQVREEDLLRVFRAAGAVLGVSLGLYLLAEIVLWPAAQNPGATGVERWAVHADLAGLRAGLAFLYWVRYAWLEIWTLDPGRLLDRNGEILDRAAYGATVSAVGRGLVLNALLYAAVYALGPLTS